MISHKQWRSPWQPNIPGYGVTRRALLVDMWALRDWSCRIGNRQSDIPTELIRAVAEHGVLNMSQIATLVNRTRMTMKRWVEELGLQASFQNTAVMGVLDPEQLDYLIHVVNRLGNDEPVSIEIISNLQHCGDKALISVLTGVPIGTIRRAMKGLPV